jgi:hypothetical protein
MKLSTRGGGGCGEEPAEESRTTDAYALKEMLQTGWFRVVPDKSEPPAQGAAIARPADAYQAPARQPSALRIRLPSSQGNEVAAAHRAVQHDAMLYASVTALSEPLVFEAQIPPAARRTAQRAHAAFACTCAPAPWSETFMRLTRRVSRCWARHLASRRRNGANYL